MDLGFDEVQMLLKNSAREVLEKECPITLVRAMEEDERGFTSELWQNIIEALHYYQEIFYTNLIPIA